jgi:hypothetical protein
VGGERLTKQSIARLQVPAGMRRPPSFLPCSALLLMVVPADVTALVVSRNARIGQPGVSRPTRQRQLQVVSMHMMGHSHSHHHHHHDIHETTTALVGPSQQQIQLRRRRVALLIFCALAILGPPYWKHRALSEADIACFSVSAFALWAVDPVRREIKAMIRKLRDWSHGISKHSTGTSPWSFFQSNTAADRVTLLGCVRWSTRLDMA